MSHPLNEYSFSSTVSNAQRISLAHEKINTDTSKNIADTLAVSSDIKLMQDIVNNISVSVLDQKTPIVIAEKKKEKEVGDRQKKVGPLTILNHEPTSLKVIDIQGNPIRLERGYTYAIFAPSAENGINLVEIELPVEGSMIQKEAVYSRYGSNNDDIHDIIHTYDLQKLAA